MISAVQYPKSIWNATRCGSWSTSLDVKHPLNWTFCRWKKRKHGRFRSPGVRGRVSRNHPLKPQRSKEWQRNLKAIVKLQIAAGKANPAPPIGPALAGHGINIMAFCKEYNARTQNRVGEIIPAEITVYTDGSFTFILKSPPAPILLKKAAGIEKGSDQSERG